MWCSGMSEHLHRGARVHFPPRAVLAVLRLLMVLQSLVSHSAVQQFTILRQCAAVHGFVTVGSNHFRKMNSLVRLSWLHSSYEEQVEITSLSIFESG